MKEANIFEAWANNLMEGTWQLPDTPEKQQKLIELMSAELPVGADATNATEQLYDLIGDDELFDQLEALADQDANADARQVVFDRMQQLSEHPEVLEVINQLNIDPSYEMNPPDATNPADLEPQEPVQEIKDPATQTEDPAGTKEPAYTEYADNLSGILKQAGVPAKVRTAPDYEEELLESLLEGAMKDIDIARQDCKGMSDKEFIKAYGQSKEQWRAKHKGLIKENVLTDDTGSTLQHIKDTFKRDVKDFAETGEVSQALHDALYDYYFDDMPYGVQKARDGDPYEWVADRFGKDLGLDGYGANSPGIPDEDYGLERESIGDYAAEKNSLTSLAGLKPAVADEGAIGQALGTVAGTVLAPELPGSSVLGGILGDKLTGSDEETDEGSALQGQYGHSGKMKKFESVEADVVSRLKELSGLMSK